MVFMFLLSLSLTFIKIQIQSKVSSFQELNGYTSSMSKQTKMSDNLSFLVFAGLKAFKYESSNAFGILPSVTIPEHTLISNNYMNINKASEMIKLQNGDFLMACGTAHLEQFTEDGTSKMTEIRQNMFDPNYKCSINEIDPNMYLISYVTLPPIMYYIETFISDSGSNLIIKIKSQSMSGFASPVICKQFKRVSTDLILCIFSGVSFIGNLYDALLFPKVENFVISDVLNTHYSIYPINEITLIVFSMIPQTATVAYSPIGRILEYNTILNTLTVITKSNILDSETREYYCPLVISSISNKMFIACLCDQQFIYFQRFTNDLKGHGQMVKYDSQLTGINYLSIGVFSIDVFGIITSFDNAKNYLLAIEFPICQNKSFKIERNGKVTIVSLFPSIEPGLNQQIFFSKKYVDINESNPVIQINVSYDSLNEFTYITGGVFTYLFWLVEEIKGSDAHSFECTLTVDVCNNRCATCVQYGDDLDNQCLTCSPGYHLDPSLPNQCIDTPPSDGSFIDPDDNTVKPCYLSCKTCSDLGSLSDTKCDSCDTSAYYPHPLAPNQCVNIPIDYYYIDSINKRYSPCYTTCKQCTGAGITENNMCTSCITGYVPDPTSPTDCINSCKANNQNIYYDASLDFYCTPSKECLTDKPYLITNIGECVETCPSNADCIKLCPLCPANTYANELHCNCITDGDIQRIVDNAELGIISMENGEVTFNWKNTTIDIKYSSTTFDTSSNVSWFKPEEIEKLKNIVKVSNSDDIIIYKQDIYTEGDLVNDLKYSFFYENATQMRVSDYDNLGMLMSFPIRNTSSEEYQQGKRLHGLGIDATNPLDPFFTHICYEFQTGNNTDIPRRDKYQYYLMDKSKYCPKKCSFENIDYDKDVSNCKCNKTEQTNIITQPFEDFKVALVNSILDANWEVIICDMLVFNNKIIPTNIGHWFVLSILILSIANFIVFLQKNFTPLEFYLKSLGCDPTQQAKDKLSKSNSKRGASKDNTDLPGIGINSIIIQGVGVNSSLQVINEPQQVKDKLSKSNSKIGASKDNTDFPGIGINSIVNQGVGVNSSMQVINEPNQSFVYSNIKQLTPLSEKKYTFIEYKKMSFEEILLKDKRSFIQHYWDNLKLVQPIIYTFFIHSKMTIPTVKIAVFMIGITIDFSLSAFFFSDKYISQIYKGEQSIFYNLPISIYTFLVRSLFGIGFYFLTTTTHQIDKIESLNNGQNKELLSQQFMKWYQIRITIFFSLKCSFLLFFWYYTAAFCGTYKNSQQEWIISGFTSFFLSQMFPFVVALAYTGLIEISIKEKNRCLYKVYKLI